MDLARSCSPQIPDSKPLQRNARFSPAFPTVGQIRFSSLLLLLACLAPAVSSAHSTQESADCSRLLLDGKYQECVDVATRAIADGKRGEEWPASLIRAQVALGRYPEAKTTLEASLAVYSASVRLRMLGYEVCRLNGDVARAQTLLREIDALVGRAAWRYSDPVDRVVLGRAALLLGAEPRQVLELFFDRVKKDRPDLRDVYLAIGELGLDKHDYDVAAQAFQEAVERFPNDPDMHFGLARSFAPSDSKQTAESLARTLELNSNHVPAVLFQADHFIDSERYEEAEKWLEHAVSVNAWKAEAWAYRAVLAHLRGDSAAEQEHRQKALHYWKTNPAVDHLIGRKLSQKYRFAEGAASQRRALAFDSDYLPAKIQLAQDLLRLGLDDEGWQHAEEVHQRDRYDVAAYNLVTLRDNVAKFETLRDESFVVHMDPREAALYGDRVLGLLRRAKQVLGEKYQLELKDPVAVEIFPKPNDFAVRTFGMPGVAGFLGVCFGKVITANSPASQGDSPTNWESVLWHEFCHVVTLQLTGNKMPRWLSEGISVYEERQANSAWGQRMTPKYREMILGGELTPVSKLSGAFLSPPSGLHLQFAYFESSLVVEFLIERFGLEAIRRLLADLKNDQPINVSLQAISSMPIADLEAAFDEFARKRAGELAPGAELTRDKLPDPRDTDREKMARWVENNPSNFWGRLQYAAMLTQAREWSEAKPHLERAIELYPDYTGNDGPYKMLATAHRELKEVGEERATLEKLVAWDPDDVASLLRLLEIAVNSKDWESAGRFAELLIGVQPLLPQPHRAIAQSSEATGKADTAIAAYRRVLLMEPPDPADVHFRLAKLLHANRDELAKRHVLHALEDAPRFPEALDLLLNILGETNSSESANSAPPASEPAPAAKPKGEPAAP